MLVWRRSFDVAPPALETSDARHPSHDRRYAALGVAAADLPAAESLADTIARFLPCWHEAIAPAIRAGKRILIAAHGNSLRALIKHLDRLSDAQIMHVEVPTGSPLVYELDEDLAPIRSYYLSDATSAAAAAAAKLTAPAQSGP